MEVNITNKPWHYQFYEFNGGTDNSTDICTYSRKVMMGMFWTGVLMAVIVFAGLMIIEPVMSVGLWLVGDHPFMTFFNDVGELLWAIDTVLVLLVLVFGSCELGDRLYKKRKSRKREKQRHVVPAEPGFLKTWYKSVKEKTCFLVTFTGEEKEDDDDNS